MKKYISKSILILAIITLSLTTNSILAQTKKDNKKTTAGKYKSVRIGDQIWMTENLNVDFFRNGDSIKESLDSDEWWRLANSEFVVHPEYTPLCCYIADEAKIQQQKEKVFNRFAVSDPRGLAPKGWHIPSKEEWKTLINYLGGENIAGEKLKSEIGFNALPIGYRAETNNNRFKNFNYGTSTVWWSSTECEYENLYKKIEHNLICFELKNSDAVIQTINYYDGGGYSVRCIKDDNILDEDINLIKTSSKTPVSSKLRAVKSKKTTSSSTDMSGFHLTGHKNTGMDAYTDAERAEIKKKQQDKERHQVELNKKAQQKFDEERAQKTNVPKVKARVRGENEPANTIAK